jgi:alkylated DNA repair dioxygenase AlkB
MIGWSPSCRARCAARTKRPAEIVPARQKQASIGDAQVPIGRDSEPRLFELHDELPPGFRYQSDLISAAEEASLLHEMSALEFKPFEFQGFTGKRRVVSFGWRYDFNGGGLQKTGEIPDFLLPLREAAGRFAGLDASRLQQVLLTEYPPGATIGWHKDRSVFAEVVGISLLSSCTFRFRKAHGKRWLRRSLVAEPRSAYLLAGPSRSEWEHSIPAVSASRYSITFRSFRDER